MENIELDYGAITFDNSVLKGEGYKFYEGLLAQMRQFKDSPVIVLQTDIVHNEAIKHIGQEITKTRALIDRALRSASKQLKINASDIEKAADVLSVSGHEHDIASARLLKYYDFIGAEKIDSAEHADLSALMKKYFETKAPFEERKDKKNEFPDAIALMSIDGWAGSRCVNVIAVSQDNGWKEYAESSSRITLVSSLAEALEKFQPHNKVSNIIAHIREDSLFDEDNHVLRDVEKAIANSIDGYGIAIEASSYMSYEWDDTFAMYMSHEFDTDEKGLVKVRIIRIDEQSIVLKVGVTVEVEVEASFSFYIRDSIDKDYVGLGGNVCKTTEMYHTDILLTLTGDFSLHFTDIEVSEIEVLETIAQANFGDIAPDWVDEQEYEKL